MAGAHRKARIHAAWQQAAEQGGLWAWLLWPVSQVYGLLVAARHRLYGGGWWTSECLPVPVLVVGNVVVGGAGKTPTVIALVQALRERGWTPGVVSRGYGRQTDRLMAVTPDTPPSACGDEPLLIHQATQAPTFVARRRAEAAHALLAAHPEVNLVVCDDGLQHLALHSDVNITVFDDRGTGNGWLLPAGLLREPWPPRPGAPRSNTIVLHQVAAAVALPVPPGVAVFRAVRALAVTAHDATGHSAPLEQLRHQPLTALAGIARPDAFFDMLRQRGLTLAHEVALPDHADPAAYAPWMQAGGPTLICTEKDAVKLFPLLRAQALQAGGVPVQAWAVPLTLRADASFYDAVDAQLTAARQHR